MKSRLQLAGHPLHPMLVQFPIALWSTALLFDLAYLWQRDSLWYWLAYYDMAAGYVGALAAAAAGTVDFFLSVPHEARVYRPAAIHGLLGGGVLLLYTINLVLRLGEAAAEGAALWVVVGLSLAGVALLVLGAWYGGELVYVHRVGVLETQEEGNVRGE